MCLAVPGKILEIKDKTAILDYGSEKREADCSLIECKVGDYVIVSNKMIIDKISKIEAEESLKMYRDAINKFEN
ncbi:HypC/HybG/HupF family hydrogenase formation chaperone [archaeon]|jgi:hydrogenase expression/formation protein HypC|nr:HypC/HybG/HupF family hydrogenase formation chaperone [archaeon]